MNNFDLIYRDALKQVEKNIESALDSMPAPVTTDIRLIEKSESTLDAWDYCYSIAIGLAGVCISTNEKFAQYLAEIHEAASGAGGEYDVFQAFLGKTLNHNHDPIDLVEATFKNRNGTNAYGLFHRLLWGHDIFAVGDDNPFRLMFQQKGLPGILQAVRHLLADTASKQGLPLPGSSFLDVAYENNKTSNYLIQIAQRLSDETIGNRAEEIYAHMMTIRAQDVTAGVVVKLVSELYFKSREISDGIRCTEIRLIAYAVNFFGEAAVGCAKQNGVPYINIPLATAMVTSFGKFCYLNDKEIKRLTEKTIDLHAQVDALNVRHGALSASLPKYDCSDSYIQALESAGDNLDELFNFLGEEKI